MWTLRNIYFYLVCFVSIILIIIGLITFFHSLTNLFFPTDIYYPSKIESLNKYNENLGITKEEFQASIEEERKINEERERNRKIRDCIANFSMFAVALPFYLYHWRKIQQERA